MVYFVEGCRRLGDKEEVRRLEKEMLEMGLVMPRFRKYAEAESRRRSATYIREENTHAHTLSLQ